MGSKNQNLFAPMEEQLTTELKQESKSVAQNFANEPVQITIEEHLNVEISRDGIIYILIKIT